MSWLGVTNRSIIYGPIGLSPSALPQATANTPYAVQINPTGGNQSNVILTYVSGPSWMSPSPVSGASITISGTPTQAENDTVIISAVDSSGDKGVFTLSLTVSGSGGGSSTGFSPQPNYGFSVSGTPAFEQSFTITNSSAPFGPTGPTLVMFDDFRNGVAGTQMTNGTAGVAGSSTWITGPITPGQLGMPFWQSGNRSGSGQCMRIYNDNRTFSPYLTGLAFANTNAIYMFWAENPHGADYNNIITNFGNNWNYKMTWFEVNGFSAGAFNMVCPIVALATAGVGGSNIDVNSNDGIKSGGPLPDWFLTGASGWWDPTPGNWTSTEVAYVADPNNPTTGTNSIEYLATYNPTSTRKTFTAPNPFNTSNGSNNNNTNVLFNSGSGSKGTYAFANQVQWPGLIEGGPPAGGIIDRADAYVAIGPNCLNRFFIGDQPTIGACTTIMPCTITSWGTNSVTMTLRKGAFANPYPNYLFWSDQNNNINLAGQFTPPVVFNFFISTTGSDSNAGTLSSPWAITSLLPGSANQSKLAGKNVGLIAGTYNLYSGVQGQAGDGFVPYLNIQGGTATNPTYIAPCDTSGNYSRGAAVIDVSLNNQGVTFQTTTTPPLGQVNMSSMGNLTLDGIKFQNYAGKCVSLGADSAGSPTYTGYTVQNCEFANQNATGDAGGFNNCSSIEMRGAIGALIFNNYFHGQIGTAGTKDGNHLTATIQWQSHSCIYDHNTMLGPGLYGKEAGNSGTIIRYNYVDTTGYTSCFGVQDFVGVGGDPVTGLTTLIHHNVFVAPQNDQRPTLSPPPSNLIWTTFNNTWVVLSSGQSLGPTVLVPTGQATFYNNVVYSEATGDLDMIAVNVDGPGLWDYNNYYSTTGTYVYGYFTSDASSSRNGVTTLAAWQAQMHVAVEAHAKDHINPLLVSPGSTGASNYKLQATSPVIGAGSTTGTTAGTACDMGAWGNGAPTTIGSSLGPQ